MPLDFGFKFSCVSCFLNEFFVITDISLTCEQYIFHPLDTSYTHAHEYWMFNCMSRFFRSMGSDGFLTWLWDLDILWNTNLFQMIKMESGMLHNPWDPRITWSDIVFLMVCVFGRMQHIQWDLWAQNSLDFHKFIQKEKWFDFLHGKSYGGWTQYFPAWWVYIFHQDFSGDTKQCRGWCKRHFLNLRFVWDPGITFGLNNFS